MKAPLFPFCSVNVSLLQRVMFSPPLLKIALYVQSRNMWTSQSFTAYKFLIQYA